MATPDRRYTMRRLLGRGGMGEIWLAHDARINRDVAIKLMRRDLSQAPVMARRLLQEGRAACSIRHEHVAEITDFGATYDGNMVLVPMLVAAGARVDAVDSRGFTPLHSAARCDFRLSCGGCRARSLAAHGDLMAEDPKCPYVRPPGALPETRPAAAARPAVAWEAAALARLERIPAFVRDRVRARLEDAAAKEGADRITVEFVQRHRPPAPFHPAGPGTRPGRAPGGT